MDIEGSGTAIFYLHIPKTGGQTLAVRLASAFLPSDVHMFNEELHYPGDLPALRRILSEKKLVESHISGQLLAEFMSLDILASVREPVAQMVSNYRHIRREPSNRWHRAAQQNSPADFFDRFGSAFTNHQSRYILSAFVDLQREIDRSGYYATFAKHFFASVERIRWLVPTESIDEFVDLWSIECQRPVPNARAMVNAAPDDAIDSGAVQRALQGRPHLYAFDALLYQVAVDRFKRYRGSIWERLRPWSYPDNSRRAYFSEAEGIWLTENWYDPEVSDRQCAWWSGPDLRSEIRFRHAGMRKFLCFDVQVVNGICYDQIEIFAKHDFRPMSVTRITVHADLTIYCVAIDSLPSEDALLLTVPDCMAAIVTTPSDNSHAPCAFLAANWRLRDTIPVP